MLYFLCLAQSVKADEMPDEEFQKILRSLVRDTFFDIVNDPVFGGRLLKTPFYFSTKPFTKRPLYSSELFQLDCECVLNTKKSNFIVTPFYLQTTRLYYNGQSDDIASYVDIKQSGLIKTLDDLKFSNTELPEMLNLFAPLHVQERRVGCMFEYIGCLNDRWTYKISLPFLYQEYNYYLSSEERKSIQDFFSNNQSAATQAPATQGTGSQGLGDLIKFIQRHLISDKCGCSDGQIFFKRWYQKPTIQGFLGCGVIIPTAFPLKQGLLGNHFNTKKERPTFDLHADLIELYVDGYFDQLKINAIDLAIQITDRLSTLLLEQKLGNGRHWGIVGAGYLEKQWGNISSSLYIKSDLLLPMIEKRFIRKTVDTDELNVVLGAAPINEQQAAVDVSILNNAFLDKMFPERYPVIVFPGIASQLITTISITGKKWKGSFGIDVWMQSQEWWQKENCKNITAVDLKVAQKSGAFQQNLFFELSTLYDKKNEKKWNVKGLISGSLISKEVGKSIGISLTFFKLF